MFILGDIFFKVELPLKKRSNNSLKQIIENIHDSIQKNTE